MREELQAKLDQLSDLVENMDVPVIYRNKIPWLSKHLASRNSHHPDFKKASQLISDLMKAGVR